MKARPPRRGKPEDHAELRAAVEGYLTASSMSLRELAQRVEVSHTALSRFLAGAGLRAATARAIQEGLARTDEEELVGRLRGSLRQLLVAVGEKRIRAVERVLGAELTRALLEAGVPVPHWVVRLGE
jgi:hypothetical protein